LDGNYKSYYMKYFEQLLWTTALVLLFFLDTESSSSSFCVFKFAGFGSCPGCGIGHAIHHVLHLNFIQSLNEHILGIPATIGILYIIFKPFITLKNSNNNGSKRHVFDFIGNSSR
jgi:uncharacterized protein DUF2752